MTTRYVKVPVRFGRMELKGTTLIGALLNVSLESMHTTTIGYGSTEDEAFADLLRKLGYEEAE